LPHDPAKGHPLAAGEEALAIGRKKRFDVVLSDVVMPGRAGLKHAETLAREQPDLAVALAIGYSQDIVEGGSGPPVILKPYCLATLSEALADAMQRQATTLSLTGSVAPTIART
jgi:CheY-like chemotaxis protein